MEFSMPFSRLVPLLAIALTVFILPVYGQINTPCTANVLNTFTPCMSFLTNSSANGTSPTSDCCNSLNSLTSNGMDCLCLIVTGSVPFRLPINRTLAISLPRACNMPGVPLQCKATGAPIPAPGPTSLAPTVSPGAPTSLAPTVSPGASPSPTAPVVPEPTPSAEAPESDTTPLLTPPSTTAGSEAPTATTGSRPVLTPSAAMPSYNLSPSLLLFALATLVLKFY